MKVIIRGDDDPRGPQTPGPTTVRAPTPRPSPTSRHRLPRDAAAAARARGVATRNQQARAEPQAVSSDSKPPSTSTKGRRSRSDPVDLTPMSTAQCYRAITAHPKMAAEIVDTDEILTS